VPKTNHCVQVYSRKYKYEILRKNGENKSEAEGRKKKSYELDTIHTVRHSFVLK
jgi:hypothetical protein